MSAIPKPPAADDRGQLLALNAEYIRCVGESDAAAFDRFLAPDFVCTYADGTVVERAEFLRRSALPASIRGIEAHGVDVRLFGDFALVLGRTTFRKGDGTLGRGCYTDAYARRDGRWLAVAAHVTRF